MCTITSDILVCSASVPALLTIFNFSVLLGAFLSLVYAGFEIAVLEGLKRAPYWSNVR